VFASARLHSVPRERESVERCELRIDAFGVESSAEPLETCSGGEEREAGSVGSTRRELCLRMQLACPRGFVRRFGIDPVLVCELEPAGGVARLAVRELSRAAGERGARGECRRGDRGRRLLQLVGRGVQGVLLLLEDLQELLDGDDL